MARSPDLATGPQPDSYVAHVATPGPQATTPVNAARTKVGGGGTCRISRRA